MLIDLIIITVIRSQLNFTWSDSYIIRSIKDESLFQIDSIRMSKEQDL